jgi:MOSC domain-containing protein YiiM
MTTERTVGRVERIALKTAVGGAMQEVDDAVAEVDGGLAGGARPSPRRGITFLASGDWRTVMSALHVDLPWHTRRANVLIDAHSIGHLIGKTVQLGEVVVEIIAETRPCDLMDQFQPGLRDALKPNCRAGVHGRVVTGGRFRIGDTLLITSESHATPSRQPIPSDAD